MSFDSIDPHRAVPVCRAAVEATPDEPRFRYQLGRALYRSGNREEAVAFLRAAAEKSYAAAENDLGSLYENGWGVTKDEAEAIRWYRRAFEDGYPAFSNIGHFYWDGIGVGMDRREATRWFERGADSGDPFSHRRLAELYETGQQLPYDLEQAFLHHAIELQLFETASDKEDAAMTRARRGSLARALPPEVALRLAHEAAGWHPKEQ